MSGHWYVDEKSLQAYQQGITEDKKDTEDASTVAHEKPQVATEVREEVAEHSENPEKKSVAPFGMKVGNVRDDTFTYDGTEYIATSRASALTGYAQDYIGQLAREGDVEARKVGRRWFVAKQTLLAHKKHNDALLAAVQADAAGVTKPDSEAVPAASAQGVPIAIGKRDVTPGDVNFNVRYIAETDQPLTPRIPTQQKMQMRSVEQLASERAQVERLHVDTPASPTSIHATHTQSTHTAHAATPQRQGIAPVPAPYPTSSYVQKPKARNGSVLSVLLLFIMVCAASMYLYLFGVPQEITTALASLQQWNVVQSVEVALQDMSLTIPGRVVEYTAR